MKKYVGFSIAGSIMTLLFFIIVNIITSPQRLWFIYPCLLLLFWPASVYFASKRQYIQYALFGSIVLQLFFIAENLLNSPEHLWFLYVIYPIMWWPISAVLGKKMGLLFVAVAGAVTTILYYGFLNMVLSPSYPWFIYPTFAILWWPLSIYHGKRKTFFRFSIDASLLISIFFITVNVVSSPGVIWAVYPVFAISWWPLSMYFYVYRKSKM